MAEGARLESVCAGNRTEGSNPSLSATRPRRPAHACRGGEARCRPNVLRSGGLSVALSSSGQAWCRRPLVCTRGGSPVVAAGASALCYRNIGIAPPDFVFVTRHSVSPAGDFFLDGDGPPSRCGARGLLTLGETQFADPHDDRCAVGRPLPRQGPITSPTPDAVPDSPLPLHQLAVLHLGGAGRVDEEPHVVGSPVALVLPPEETEGRRATLIAPF